MKRRATVVAGLMGLLFALPAEQRLRAADSGDAADVSPTPHPSPAHIHRHAHPRHSPTPAVSRDAVDDDSESAVTPAARTKHHHSTDADRTGEETPGAEETTSTPEPDVAGLPSATPSPHPIAPDASLDTDDLEGFQQLPPKVRALIEGALDLTRQNLTYTFSSADPANGGMDCSGFIYYVLTQAGMKDVPRDASGQYAWVRKAGNFRAVISRSLDGFETDELKPGDLLFWSGTYDTDHDPPVTHTMIYLGREKDTGNRVMVGSSDGRSYHGLERWGVSVFDFKAPQARPSGERTASQFIGYGEIPGL